VNAGQRVLWGEFDRTGNRAVLIAVQDFTVRTLPQLSALRPLVPPASVPGVDALLALLQQTQATLAGKIASCGPPCASYGASSLPVQTKPGGFPVTSPTTATAILIGPEVGVTASPLPVPPKGTGRAVLPPVTVEPLAGTPSPIVIVPPPSLRTPAVVSTSTPTGLLPTGLPGLP